MPKKNTKGKCAVAACYMRGNVIQKCTELEFYIDVYIAEHFSKDHAKIEQLVTLLLAPRIIWREKVEIFKVLIDKFNPSFKVQNKFYYKDIISIVEHRNIFAHLPINLTGSALNEFELTGQIEFLKFKNKTQKSTKEIEFINAASYDHIMVSEIIDSIDFYVKKIKDLSDTDIVETTLPPK